MTTGGYDVDYAALGLSAERFDAFASVFRRFDSANTGAISPKQLAALAFDLGEAFDAEELAAATASLEDEQTGLVHFAAFLQWWLSE